MRGRRRVPFSASHRGVSQKRLEKGAEAKARAEKVKEDFFYENYQKTFGGNLKRRHDRIPGVLQQSCKQFPGRVQRGWRFFCRSEQRGGPDRRKHRILERQADEYK